MLSGDPLSNVLYIDLTRKSFYVLERRDLFAKYLGGTGAAIALLHEECPPDCDPLGEENPIVFAVGPLTALYPLASKTVAVFKSPHTGNLGESHCGGRSAIAIRMAGYGAIVIKGKSEIPLYVAVHGNRVSFHDASSIWGMRSDSTGRVIREREEGAGLRTIMRIGPAGEKLVTYASVATETYRHFGRLGLGAVFGSKKLKAVVISGKRMIPIADLKGYRKLYDHIYDLAVSSPVMKKYHDLGTAENVLSLNRFKGLPVRNLQETSFEGALNLSGETFAARFLGRRLACAHCPVGCIHIAALREPYEDEPYFYKTSMISYDYEPIYALGTMLGIKNPEDFLVLMDRVEALGMDVMTTGVTLAWATEAMEKGLISVKDTMGVCFSWGDVKSYMEACRMIVEQPNEFYRSLARGVKFASEMYGGKDFALVLGGNEMPGYHTGPGAHLGVLIGLRHSHLDNAGYSFDQKLLLEREVSPEELVDVLLCEERWRQVLSSLVVCFFARGIYTPEVVLELLKTTGYEFKEGDLQQLGHFIYFNKFRFKVREKFAISYLTLPKRLYTTPSPTRSLDPEFVARALEHFKRVMEEDEKRFSP
ncbi:MAG: aldehyde ferredoxin oxidoreductase family protein [Syntrophales bacterium]|nr:aldehyde ferredoxin oxidoreductase family protein [Syntrophales bacterium]